MLIALHIQAYLISEGISTQGVKAELSDQRKAHVIDIIDALAAMLN